MKKSRYKEISLNYHEDRELYCLSFKERNSIDAKWLTKPEMENLRDLIADVLI